ncbi:MAG: hypothetical protein ACKESB_03610 [Candidatus Hodgkinia cicadicola]
MTLSVPSPLSAHAGGSSLGVLACAMLPWLRGDYEWAAKRGRLRPLVLLWFRTVCVWLHKKNGRDLTASAAKL